jgi:hypothetical protein
VSAVMFVECKRHALINVLLGKEIICTHNFVLAYITFKAIRHKSAKHKHISVYCNQRDVRFIQLIEKQRSLHVSSVAYPQETLHKRHMVYCVRIMSVGCAETCRRYHT